MDYNTRSNTCTKMSICKSVKLHQSVYMRMLDSTNVSAHKMFLLLSNTFVPNENE